MTETFFDKEFRLEEFDRCGDLLTTLNELIPWEGFLPEFETLRKREKGRKSPVGRKQDFFSFVQGKTNLERQDGHAASKNKFLTKKS